MTHDRTKRPTTEDICLESTIDHHDTVNMWFDLFDQSERIMVYKFRNLGLSWFHAVECVHFGEEPDIPNSGPAEKTCSS